MPFIEENDLLDLHKDIDKAQSMNEKLLDQIKIKNKDFKKIKLQRNLLLGFTVFVIVGFLALTSFTAGLSFTNSKTNQDNMVLHSLDSLEAYKARIANLKEQNQELSLVKEFYLAKEFLQKEIVYSVQIKSFAENNVSLTSDALTNTLFSKANPYYSYSIGTFETLAEAQDLRKHLVEAGIEDAFVASYKNGKRLKIEAPF
ncbi:SPOR domain-containing protein [Croceivirga thetidis]|uniref:SPOR domain-containing protein n=1 Tax=Croceivirga thetidis TaxID=2721623 RepID=A0ABX1GR93_9FLAO|nr:SPOR domain-containing protein [Croceivirga thetidis]NKI32104.1 SPOR domain-containing protein [Croceivirga thetidis]